MKYEINCLELHKISNKFIIFKVNSICDKVYIGQTYQLLKNRLNCHKYE